MGLFGNSKRDEALREQVLEQLKTVQDPDLHRDLVSLGFIKDLTVKGGKVAFTVELTTPACPAKEQLQQECEAAVKALDGVSRVEITMSSQSLAGAATRVANEVDQPALARVERIIAIASGKGGVGKSTTTVNLAYALSQSGAKVGILDADIYGPSIPQMTGAGKPTHMDENDHIIPPQVDDIKIISAEMFAQQNQAQMFRGPMVAQIVRQLLTQVAWGELDYLLIDYPPGTGDIQLTLSQVAPITGAVAITTPQEVALLDVRKAIQMFQTMNVPLLGVIETMSYFVCDSCEKQHELFPRGGGGRLAEEFGVPLLAEVPLDPRLAQSADAGTVLVKTEPDALGAKALRQASERMVREQAKVHAQTEGAMTHFRLEWQ